MVEKNCQFCNQNFLIYPYRIRKNEGKFCSKECYNLFRHQTARDLKKTCEVCGQEFLMKLASKGRFCSLSCYYITKKGKPLSSKHIENMKKAQNLGRFVKRMVPWNKGKAPTPETLRKMLVFRSPNKAELKLNKILKTNFPKEWRFVGDGRVAIEGKNPDFININGKKLIIDLFGKYWHEENEINPRKKAFAKYGYKTLILWDYELKNENKVMGKVRRLYGR